MKKLTLFILLLTLLVPWTTGCGGGGLGTGGPTLMFFWAEDCAFCKDVRPVVEEVERDYRRRLDVVYVSLDEAEGREVGRGYGVVGTPTILLLNSEGEVEQVLRGTIPEPLIRQAVEDLLAEE